MSKTIRLNTAKLQITQTVPLPVLFLTFHPNLALGTKTKQNWQNYEGKLMVKHIIVFF